MKNGWIGIDLDGTLAEYHGWVSEDHIGAPIAPMVAFVKELIADGKDVRIFTARVDGGEVATAMGHEHAHFFRDVEKSTKGVQAWCLEHLGVALPVTCKKDFGMIALYDDRAFHVIPNTGIVLTPQRVVVHNLTPDEAEKIRKAMAP
jgi:hypothetical protein